MNSSWIVPEYGRNSLETVFPSVAGAMGVPDWANTLGLPEAKRYVVVLVDGMGDDLLAEHATIAPYLSSLRRREPMTCGVPSTTATSLTSLGTGLTMGMHGIVGYTSLVPGTTNRLNSLLWDQDIDPITWQPHPTVLEQMLAAGVAASVVNKSKFEGSGLTTCSQRGVPFHGVESVWERLEGILDASEKGDRSVVYGYESDLDHAGHANGCQSLRWRDCLARIDADLRLLREELPADVALLVTADHGMVDVPHEQRFDLDQVADLRDGVHTVAGEARFRHLYTTAGAAETVRDRWRAELGDRALVHTRAEAEAAGWFGKISESTSPRIGDVVVAALDDFAVFSSADFRLEMKMTGFHGSLTPVEMHIPLLVDF